MLPIPKDLATERLKEFQARLRTAIMRNRSDSNLHQVSRDSAADTIYQLDAAVEPLLEEFCEEWSRTTPLVLIAEGIEGDGLVAGAKVFPHGARESDAMIRLIVDPIDGTRGLMYDKRSAWTLAGVAPNRGAATTLADVEVAVMSELPTSKMGYADVLWAARGEGASGLRVDLRTLQTQPLSIRPSTAANLEHGFAAICSFFPGTKVQASQMMEALAEQLIGPVDVGRALIFDDQYISTGGQFYELLMGHDRFIADLRPVFYRRQNQPPALCCHPYDCAAMLIAQEAGVFLTDEFGRNLNAPMDVTSGVSWIGYANSQLRRQIEPILLRMIGS